MEFVETRCFASPADRCDLNLGVAAVIERRPGPSVHTPAGLRRVGRYPLLSLTQNFLSYFDSIIQPIINKGDACKPIPIFADFIYLTSRDHHPAFFKLLRYFNIRTVVVNIF